MWVVLKVPFKRHQLKSATTYQPTNSNPIEDYAPLENGRKWDKVKGDDGKFPSHFVAGTMPAKDKQSRKQTTEY